AGQLYGVRAHGSYKPAQGHRFNAAKLLLDPYALAITGGFQWCDEMFGYVMDAAEDRDLKRDLRDNAWAVPKCVVVDGGFDWGDDARLNTPLADSVIYELHVKGFSKLHPLILENIRGTYS